MSQAKVRKSAITPNKELQKDKDLEGVEEKIMSKSQKLDPLDKKEKTELEEVYEQFEYKKRFLKFELLAELGQKKLKEQEELKLKHRKNRSQDELHLLSQQDKTRFDIAVETKTEKPAKTSLFGKILNAVKNNIVSTKIINVVNRFKNSKVGKILFSKAVGYSVSLGLIALTLSGLVMPLTTVILITSISAVIGISFTIINEIRKIHSLSKLCKECNLLVHYRNTSSIQKQLLLLAPDLKQDLGKELKFNNKSEQNCKDRYEVHPLQVTQWVPSVFNTANMAAFVATAIHTGNVPDVIKGIRSIVDTAILLRNTHLDAQEKAELDRIFKTTINTENNQKDTPYYNNLDELREATKQQIIQTIALKKLISYSTAEFAQNKQGEKPYSQMSREEKSAKFQEIMNSIAQEIDQNNLNSVMQDLKEVESFIENIGGEYKEGLSPSVGRFLNPFSKPFVPQKYSPLSIVWTKDNFVERLNDERVRDTKKRSKEI